MTRPFVLGWASRAPTGYALPRRPGRSRARSRARSVPWASDAAILYHLWLCVSRSLDSARRLAWGEAEDQDDFFAGTGYSQVPSGSPGDVACPCIDPFNVAFNYFNVTNPFARCFAETAERVGLNERARTTSRAIERVSEVVPSRTGYWRSELYIL